MKFGVMGNYDSGGHRLDCLAWPSPQALTMRTPALRQQMSGLIFGHNRT
jgi:hypothetical protein